MKTSTADPMAPVLSRSAGSRYPFAINSSTSARETTTGQIEGRGDVSNDKPASAPRSIASPFRSERPRDMLQSTSGSLDLDRKNLWSACHRGGEFFVATREGIKAERCSSMPRSAPSAAPSSPPWKRFPSFLARHVRIGRRVGGPRGVGQSFRQNRLERNQGFVSGSNPAAPTIRPASRRDRQTRPP
jgi:hypothetical protein